MSRPRIPKHPDRLLARIMALAARPRGVTWREVRDVMQHVDRKPAEAIFWEVARGLHRRQDGRQDRYFTDLAAGTAWTPTPKLPRIAFNTRAKPEPVTPTTAPRIIRAPAWTHDPRFQLPPGHTVVGGFASLGVGRYLEDGT